MSASTPHARRDREVTYTPPTTSMTQTHVLGKIKSGKIYTQYNVPAFGKIFPHKKYPVYGIATKPSTCICS